MASRSCYLIEAIYRSEVEKLAAAEDLSAPHRLQEVVPSQVVEGITVPDHLHLAVEGYQVWADALKPLLTQWLGPAAASDSDPVPTPDPSTAAIYRSPSASVALARLTQAPTFDRMLDSARWGFHSR